MRKEIEKIRDNHWKERDRAEKLKKERKRERERHRRERSDKIYYEEFVVNSLFKTLGESEFISIII